MEHGSGFISVGPLQPLEFCHSTSPCPIYYLTSPKWDDVANNTHHTTTPTETGKPGIVSPTNLAGEEKVMLRVEMEDGRTEDATNNLCPRWNHHDDLLLLLSFVSPNVRRRNSGHNLLPRRLLLRLLLLLQCVAP